MIKIVFSTLLIFSCAKSIAQNFLYNQKGVQVYYSIKETNVSTKCNSDYSINYTDTPILIWELTLGISNNSQVPIVPKSVQIATINTTTNPVTSVGSYCSFRYINDYNPNSATHYEVFLFPITRVHPGEIKPGQKVENKGYLYLYKGVKPIIENWSFAGFNIGKSKENKLNDDFWNGNGSKKDEIWLEENIAKSTNNQYIGNITTNSQYLNIDYRDHGSEDGDIVSIYQNGILVADNITLSNSKKTLKFKLYKGVNRFTVEAINEGTASPNTAEFTTKDASNNLIDHYEWNLNTGYKATFLIFQE